MIRVSHLAAAAVGAAVMIGAVELRRRRRRRRTYAVAKQGAHTAKRRLGQSRLEVTVLGQGGASLGDLYTKLEDESALRSLSLAVQAGISFYDTSPWYGVGLSEMRFGLALHRLPRDDLIVQTKVGRFLVPDASGRNGVPVGWIGGLHNSIRFDYSGPALERQLEDILQRTGLGRIESLVIHDLEPTPHRRAGGESEGGDDHGDADDGMETAARHLHALRHRGGFAALQRMRREGRIAAFGAGMNIDENGEDPAKKRSWNRAYLKALLEMHHQPPQSATASQQSDAAGEETAADAADTAADAAVADGEGSGGPLPGERGLDFLLIANMHSLLTTEAADIGLLDACLAAGVSLVVGGPFSSGILATGADPPGGTIPYYNYRPASDAVRARCRRIEAVCAAWGVPLIAAALQYPLRHPAVSCVIPGAKNEAEVASNVALMNVPIPEGLWAALEDEGLLPRSVGAGL